jgi:hypothetical protein
MAVQTIMTRTGHVVTGRIIDHRGGGMVEVEAEGKRYVGLKVRHRAHVRTSSA